MKMQKAFTLIELMIVIAVIGILVAIAIPAYSDYIKRAKVVEGMNLLGGLKTPALEWIASKGSNSSFPSVASFGGRTSGIYTTKIGLDGSFAYSAAFLDADLTGKLVFSYDSDTKIWDCISNTSIPGKYLPSICRP